MMHMYSLYIELTLDAPYLAHTWKPVVRLCSPWLISPVRVDLCSWVVAPSISLCLSAWLAPALA